MIVASQRSFIIARTFLKQNKNIFSISIKITKKKTNKKKHIFAIHEPNHPPEIPSNHLQPSPFIHLLSHSLKKLLKTNKKNRKFHTVSNFHWFSNDSYKQ